MAVEAFRDPRRQGSLPRTVSRQRLSGMQEDSALRRGGSRAPAADDMASCVPGRKLSVTIHEGSHLRIDEMSKGGRGSAVVPVPRRSTPARRWEFPLTFATPALLEDRDFMLEAVECNGMALSGARGALRGDREITLAAVRQNGEALLHADNSFKCDRDIILTAMRQYSDAIAWADKTLARDREFVLQAVAINGKAIRAVEEPFKHDREIVLAAIESDASALFYVGAYKSDPGFVLDAVHRNPEALLHADAALRCDRDFVERAVRLQGMALYWASDKFLSDRGVVLEALKSDWLVAQYSNVPWDDALLDAVLSHWPAGSLQGLEIVRPSGDTLTLSGDIVALPGLELKVYLSRALGIGVNRLHLFCGARRLWDDDVLVANAQILERAVQRKLRMPSLTLVVSSD